MLRKLSSVAVSLLLLLSAWNPAQAAVGGGMEEEGLFTDIPTVITASLKRQALDKVPGTMTVFTDGDIESLGFHTLDQLLATVPGFQFIQATYGPKTLVVCGYSFSGANVKMMIDGHSVNESNSKSFSYWTELPLDNVKQVEIIRGPGSSLYGTDALSAVVNVITKKEKGGLVSATGGTLGRWGTNAAVNGDPEAKFKYRASFNQFGEQGDLVRYKSDWLQGTGYSLAPLDKTKPSRRYDAGATLGYGDFSLTARHMEGRKEWSEGYLGVETPARTFITSRQSFAEAQYRHAFSDDTALSLKASFDTDYVAYTGQVLPGGFDFNPFVSPLLGGPFPPGTLPFLVYGPEGANFKSWTSSEKVDSQALFETSLGKHSLVGGVEYGRIYFPESRSTHNYNQTDLTPLTGGPVTSIGQDAQNYSLAENTHEGHWGVFGQDILDLRPVTLILGARYDHYDLAGGAFAPRVALIYDAPWNQIFKASFGQAFFAPYASARYTQAFGYTGDPKIKPEIVKTYEVSVQNSFATRAHYAVSGFMSDFDDAYIFDPSRRLPLYAYANIAEWRYAGVEVEGRVTVGAGVNLWGNYAFFKKTHTKNLAGGDADSSSPRIGNAGIQYVPMEPLKISVSGRFRSANRPIPNHHVAGWGILNASVSYAVTKNFDLQLSGENLLDKETFSYNNGGRFLPPPFTSGIGADFPMPGRQLFSKLTYHWGGKS